MSGDVWIASYVALWVAVIVLSVAVVALLRQIGVLHTRIRPMGVHHAGEGPPRDVPAPVAGGFDYSASPLTLLAFTAPGCEICRSLLPSLRVLADQYDEVSLEVVDHGPDTLEVFRAFKVTSTPYLVLVDRLGVVRGGGVANTLEQAEILVESTSGRHHA